MWNGAAGVLIVHCWGTCGLRQAVSWTLYELLQHPEVEQQLLQELHEVLGALPAGSSSRQAVHPSYEQIRQLRFTRACFLEALRLHPSVPEVTAWM